MNDKSIIIIGAGIAGLSAGCYGQMNDYSVRIFEQDAQPGGLCTSWERKGFTINGGLAFLGGSSPNTNFYRIWEELGVIPQIRMIDYEYFVICEGREGKKLFLYTDVDRLEQHMKGLSPEDEKVIDDLIEGIRVFIKYQLPIEKAQELLTPFEKIRFMFTHFPILKAMGKWKKVSVKEFASRFKDPFLREAFVHIKGLFSDDLPIMIIQMFLAWSHLKSAGYPEGGAFVLPKAIEDRFLKLGGEIKYRSKVTKILVKDGKAAGVRLEDGSEHRSNHVISAADGRTTLYKMLGEKYLNDKIRGYYGKFPLAPQVMIVALGLSRRFEDIPHSGIGIIFTLKEPVTIGEKELRSLRPMIYNFDPALAPEGKTLMRIVLPTDYDYWKNFKKADESYKEEKQRIADKVIGLLEQRFPGISSDIEMIDVVTPLTFEHYTSNWKGSIIGWDATTETAFKPIPKYLPGLKNFWMAGQWVEPGGGIPMVALSGRNVIQLIAKKDKKQFAAHSQ